MTVILVIHILVSLVLVFVVLMQRSEGGALGIGGGGGGGLVSGRGAAGALVRTTIIFGAIFFITSLVLTTMSTHSSSDGRTAIERQLDEEAGVSGEPVDPLDVLDDPTAPLLDSGPSLPSTGTEPGPTTGGLDSGESETDPLAADIPDEDGNAEAVDEPQP